MYIRHYVKLGCLHVFSFNLMDFERILKVKEENLLEIIIITIQTALCNKYNSNKTVLFSSE